MGVLTAARPLRAAAPLLAAVAGACLPPATDYAHGTHVVLLGTGTPNPEPDRAGPAVAIVVDGTPYVVDAGVGVVRRAAAAAAEGVTALDAEHLDRVFLTHLHSDHTLGLPDLVLTPWVLERDRPLEVYGPEGTADMVRHLLAAYDADIRRRRDGLQPHNASGIEVVVHEIATGEVYRDVNVTVTAVAVAHEAWPHAYAYRFATPDAVIVLSGDTRPTDAVATACGGCDLLVHEVYSDAGFVRRPSEWQRYHASAHTSATELAAVATQARPDLLVLFHQLLWGSTPEELVAEVLSAYDGQVVYGRDLDIFSYPR